jgi:hypothetical protein
MAKLTRRLGERAGAGVLRPDLFPAAASCRRRSKGQLGEEKFAPLIDLCLLSAGCGFWLFRERSDTDLMNLFFDTYAMEE